MHLIKRLMFSLRTQSTERFIESMIACFAAPVISGLKCAKLLNFSRKTDDLPHVWRSVREDVMGRLSVEAVEVSATEHSALLLIYRSAPLLQAVSSEAARAFLVKLGYEDRFTSVAPHLSHLIHRFSYCVPHEVGLFLGYPLEDVVGFIENKGRNSKMSGYWKVYGDEALASRTFEAYRRAELMSASLLLREEKARSHSLYETLPAA